MMDESIKVPAGFHFAPFEKELINLYLKPKVLGQKLPCNIVEERQLYGPNANPWQLFDPENHSWLLSEATPGKFEKIIYVFVNLIKKGTGEGNKKSKRVNYNKKAGCGTWDGQTKRTEIRDCNGDLIGERRMLSFEINEVSDQDLSKLGNWRMHEYHLCGVNKDISNPGNTVLCKITLDPSKNPPVKLRSKGNQDHPIKSSSKPQKKNTNVHIVSSPSTVNSGFGECNQGVPGNSEGAITTQTRPGECNQGVFGRNSEGAITTQTRPGECNQGVSGNSEGAITTQTRPDDSVVSDSYRVKGKEGCDGTENVETSDGVECVNNCNVEEDNIAVIASSPSEKVKTGYLNPSIFDFHWPAKNDNDCKKVKMEGGGGDLHFAMTKVQFSKYQKPKEEQPVEEATANLGKRKRRVETSYTMTKKLCP